MTQELLGLITASRLSESASIYTDCKSAISTVTRYLDKRGGSGAGLAALRPGRAYHKVKAHVDRTKHASEWTDHEAGNIAADAVAAGRDYPGADITDVDTHYMARLIEADL